MYVFAVCNARRFSFLVRYKQLPPDILLLFGGFRPSQGHGLRLLKVLSSEWHRQARFYKQCLFLSLQGTTNYSGGKKWLQHRDLANAAAEFRWRQMLTELRASLPKKPSPSKDGLHSLVNVSLPENIRSVLSQENQGRNFWALSAAFQERHLLTVPRGVFPRVWTFFVTIEQA
ncbi:hypothetical protein MTO96_035025 [Rhipicephalus appendiculatus]